MNCDLNLSFLNDENLQFQIGIDSYNIENTKNYLKLRFEIG